MAIFSRTQIPKYQNPIRITRPYIKPNSLSDTITSAIQGYGSIQGMNMQQQLFNAKLKEAADTKAQNELNQVTYRQMMQQQMGTPAVNPAPYVGPMGAGPMMLGTPAEPGMNQMESVMAAMQSNPNARIQDIIAMAGGINTLQYPKKTGGMTLAQLASMQHRNRVFDRNEQRYQTGLASDQKAIVAKAGTDAQKIVGNVFGKPLLYDFQHKQDKFWSGDPESGTESTEAFLANATWFDLTGVDAYDAMMKDLEQVATKWLLEGKSPNDVRRDLHGIYRQGTQKHKEGWQQPEIPQILQTQIDETRAKNKAQRDRLTATSQ